MHGILNLNKPPGVTSRGVVNRVQRLVKPAKVGHAGTLDPLATGVLVVCVGAATRLVEYIQQMPKHYTATFRLGCESETEDIEGEIRPLPDAPQLSRADIETALPNFIGDIAQRPPAYSAVKIQGERAYKLARAGKQVDAAPRKIHVHELNLRTFAYPRMTIDIVCGSGTYVRSLGRDIAQSLGSGAVMEELMRTAIGSFEISKAISPSDFDEQDLRPFLLPLTRAVDSLPAIVVNADEIAEISHGRTILRTSLEGSDPWAAIDNCGALVAIMTRRGSGQVGPVKSFVNIN